MAKPVDNEFFGIPIPIDREETDRFLKAIDLQRSTGEAGVRRAEQEKRRLDRYAEQAGIDPVPEKSDSFLYNLTDTLDTPRQWVAGGIAQFVNQPGYADIPFLDAVKKAAEEDLTTGEMLRRVPGLDSDEDIPSATRAVLGFVGDVVTDPITYINPVAGVGKKVGFKAVTQFGDDVARKLITKALEGVESPARFKQIATALEGRIPGISQAGAFSELPEALQGRVLSTLEEDAVAPFKQLAIHQEAAKNYQKAGVGILAPEEFANSLLQEKQKISKALGIDKVEELDNIFAKPRITYSGPFAGGGILGRLPALGTKEGDIPVVSDLSEELYSAIGKGYYGAKQTVKDYFAKGLEKNPESQFFRAADKIGDLLSVTRDKLNRYAGIGSLRALASGDVFGSSIPKKIITEAARADGALFKQTIDETDFIFRHLPEEIRKNEGLMKKVSHLIEKHADGPGGYKKALQALKVEFDNVLPGAGDKMVTTVESVTKLFDDLARTEMDQNLLGEKIKQGYVYHMYGLPEGMEDVDASQWQRMAEFFNTPAGTADLSLRRSVGNISKAKAIGLTPEENIVNIVNARLYWHKKALMEKDYAERFISYWALDRKVYDKLQTIVREGSDAERKAALSALNKVNLKLDPESAFIGVKTHTGGKIPFTPQSYAHVKQVVQGVETILAPQEVAVLDNYFKQKSLGGDTVLDPSVEGLLEKANKLDNAYTTAKAQQAHAGLKFTPDEATTIEATWNTLLKTSKAAMGRDGEFAYARAGARTLEDAQLKTLKNLSPEDKEFWSGLLPDSFYQAWEDSMKGYGLLKAYADKLTKSGVKDPMRDPILKALKLYDWHHKRMKAGATVFWPAYFLRNVYSGLAQGLEQASMLGEQFSIPRMVKNHGVMSGADLVTDSGRVISHKQLMAELSQHGMKVDATSQRELLDEVLNVTPHAGESNAYLSTVPAARKAFQNKPELEKLNLYRKLEQKMGNVSSVIETKGRQHLYLNLRAKGFDAASASAEVNRLLIDYAHGKTAFERQILNNAFFFYSFSRGNVSNMFHAIVKKPGALTGQLHFHKGIAELLSDPASLGLTEDDKLAIETNRTREMLTTFLGNNPVTGLPRVLEGTGMPIEEVGKWLGAIEKPNSLKWGDILTAAGSNVQRTALNVFSQANPLIKGAVEVMAQKNFYFDRPLTDETLRKIPSWEKDTNTIANYAFNAIPESVWNTLDDATMAVLDGRKNGDGTITINPYAMATLSYLVPVASRFIATRSALTDLGASSEEKLLRAVSGVKVNEVDPEKSLAYDELRRAKDWYEMKGSPRSRRELRLRRLADEE